MPVLPTKRTCMYFQSHARTYSWLEEQLNALTGRLAKAINNTTYATRRNSSYAVEVTNFSFQIRAANKDQHRSLFKTLTED